MSKFFLILIFVNSIFISKAFGNLDSKVLEFNRWLNLNGYDQYLDKTGDPIDIVYDRSLCSPKSTWDCVDADGKTIPAKDRKAVFAKTPCGFCKNPSKNRRGNRLHCRRFRGGSPLLA